MYHEKEGEEIANQLNKNFENIFGEFADNKQIIHLDKDE